MGNLQAIWQFEIAFRTIIIVANITRLDLHKILSHIDITVVQSLGAGYNDNDTNTKARIEVDKLRSNY